MMYLLLSIACSTAIMLIFRWLDRYKVHGFYAIILNYWVCVITGIVSGAVSIDTLWAMWQAPWLPIALLLGALFIGGFYTIQLTVRHSGITVASIASKNAMVISVTAAFFLYGDVVSPLKILGILTAIIAVVLASVRKKTIANGPALGHGVWVFPLLAFLTSGTIETLLKYAQHFYLSQEQYPLFLIFLFGTAAIIGSIFYVVTRFTPTHQAHWQWRHAGRNLLGGIALGLPNYGSIYFLIRTLEQPAWESSIVYPVNNIGVVLAAAIAAYIFFREKPNRYNAVGIVLAIVAIILITGSTMG